MKPEEILTFCTSQESVDAEADPFWQQRNLNRRAMKPLPKLGIFEILLLGAACVVVAARVAGSLPFDTFIILLLIVALILAIRLWRR
jgi:hypothetical protein